MLMLAPKRGLIYASRATGMNYWTCYSICQRLGVEPKRFHPPVPPSRIAAAKRLRKKGLTLVEIGKRLGVSHTQARNFILKEAA